MSEVSMEWTNRRLKNQGWKRWGLWGNVQCISERQYSRNNNSIGWVINLLRFHPHRSILKMNCCILVRETFANNINSIGVKQLIQGSCLIIQAHLQYVDWTIWLWIKQSNIASNVTVSDLLENLSFTWLLWPWLYAKWNSEIYSYYLCSILRV